MHAFSPAQPLYVNGAHTAAPKFGNGWQRLMGTVAKGGQQLSALLQQAKNHSLVRDTFYSLKHSQDFQLQWLELLPATLTASTLLYLLAQEKRQHDDPKAPLRLLAESAATYALTTYTSNVIPVLGILGLAYTAGQQETVLDKVKHSGVVALGTVGSLLGVSIGIGFNVAQTQRDVGHTLAALPTVREYLRKNAEAIVKAWKPEVPSDITDAGKIREYTAQQRKQALDGLTHFETDLTKGHEALLKAYRQGPNREALSERLHLRQQLHSVFTDLWTHLKPAQEALSAGAESDVLKQVLKLSRHLEVLNTGYVKAARWLNPVFFGVLGSLAFQWLVPSWQHFCDWLFNNRLGQARLEMPSHTLLGHGGDGSGNEEYNAVLLNQHLYNRFNAFTNTHQMAQEVFMSPDLITKATRGN